jgi:hypothetical protein
MIAGVVPHPTPAHSTSSLAPPGLTSLLILAYSPPDTSFLNGNEMTEDRSQQARKAAERPELRIISRAGEELAADALSITDFHLWGCNDYVLAEVTDDGAGRCYVVLSPRDIVLVKPRDRRDHVQWLVERRRYEEALEQISQIEDEGPSEKSDMLSATEIGQKYIEHLVSEGMCPSSERQRSL